jgi:hypothetical protein
VLPEVLLQAIRIQSVDVANLTSQVAVFRAHAEQIGEVLHSIDVRSWEHRMTGEGEDSRAELFIPPDQEMALQRLLSLCESVS